MEDNLNKPNASFPEDNYDIDSFLLQQAVLREVDKKRKDKKISQKEKTIQLKDKPQEAIPISEQRKQELKEAQKQAYERQKKEQDLMETQRLEDEKAYAIKVDASEEKRSKGARFLSIVIKVLIILLSALIVYQVYLLGQSYLEFRTKEGYNNVNIQAQNADDPIDDLVFQLQQNYKNEDIVGFLSIEDTNIKYPVTQDESAFYYDHAIDKRYNPAGALRLDMRNNIDGTDPNTIIFGNNLSNGTMFHDLSLYEDSAFAYKHTVISYTNLHEKNVYDVCAFYSLSKAELMSLSFSHISFDTDDSITLEEFEKSIKEKTILKVPFEFTHDSKILTLVTTVEFTSHEDDPVNGIYVLHAIKREYTY